MKMPIKYPVMAACLLATAVWLHGDYPATLAVDMGIIGVTLIALSWMDPKCAGVERREALPSGRLPEAVRYRHVESRFKAFALALVVIFVTFLTQYGTIEGWFHYRQIDAVLTRVDHLIAAGNHQDAAGLLEKSLREAGPKQATSSLKTKLLECWLLIAARGTESERGELVTHAKQVVQKGLIEQAALTTLQRFVKSLESEAELAKSAKSAADQAAREKTKRLIAESLADKREQRLAAERTEAGNASAAAERQHAARHFTQLLAWGDSLSQNLPLQQGKYQEAIDFGRQWQFDLSTADGRLRAVVEAIRKEQPQDFAVGATAKWLALKGDWFPPAVIVELIVFDVHGHHIQSLQAKDFQIAIDGQPVVPVAVAHLMPAQQRLQIVILVDCSGSTAGPALAAAKAGISHLLAQLTGHADVFLIAFNTTTTPLSSWESTPSALVGRLTALQSAGGTALFAALDRAVAELSKRPQPRLILLFTDGKDSTGAPADATLDRLRTERIAIHAVGLETSEFDRAAMERLTTATSGSLLTAAQAPELALRFAELSLALNAPRYRLVIPCQQTTGRLHITVGGKNAAVLESRLEAATPWPPVKQQTP